MKKNPVLDRLGSNQGKSSLTSASGLLVTVLRDICVYFNK